MDKIYEELPLDIPTVFVVDYDMKQAEILLLAKGGELNVSDIPKIKFHNSYFGGGMSSIVFQDMRESKSFFIPYIVHTLYLKNQEKHTILSLM